MTETNEQLKAEIDAITAHNSETDRRVRALETTMKGRTSAEDVVTFKVPEEAVEYAAKVSLTEVEDLKRERDEARKVAANQKRVADAMADERDEVRRRVEELKLELEEIRAKKTKKRR